jgi:hypothetical protein
MLTPVLAIAAGVAMLAPPLAQPAQASERVALDYRFYLGGILIGKASIAAAVEGEAYRLDTNVRSDGVVGWFYDVTVNGVAEGLRDARAKLRPALFRFNSVAEGKKFDLDMRYAGDAPSEIKAEPPFQPRHYAIDPTQQRGALDPMSAIVAALFPDKTAPLCNRTFPIFDGRRRYDVSLEGVISEKTEGGATVIECKGRWKRVGGFKPKHMRKPDYLFTVRFSRDSAGQVLPIRAWTDTEFGAAMAMLSSLNGRRL